MNGFEKRKEKKKESIRRAAMELFAQYGFGKVSIKDIARKAGVSHVTIYNHFKNKEELISDAVRTETEKIMTMAREIMDGEDDFLRKMELIRSSKAGLANRYNGEVMKMVVNMPAEVSRYMEGLWKEETDRLLKELIDEGKQQGYINPEMSQEAILLYMDIIRAGAFANADAINRAKIDAKLADDFNRLFLYGLIEKKD